MVEPTESQRRGIQSVEIAAAILEALEACGSAATLSKIAGTAGMPASKVHRYLVSLSRVGLVNQSAVTGLYDLGPAARRLGAEAFRRTDEANVAGPHIAALRDRCGHSVNASAWGEAGPVLTRWEIGRYPMSVTVRVGGSLPLWSSVGRVFLAYLPRSVTEPVFASQRGIGVPEDVDLDALEDELQQIRTDRICSVSNTPVLGIDGLSSPVFDAFGNVALVIGVIAPRTMMGADERQHLAELLRSTTTTISNELGFRDDAAELLPPVPGSMAIDGG